MKCSKLAVLAEAALTSMRKYAVVPSRMMICSSLISQVWTLTLGVLKAAAKLIEDKVIDNIVDNRYRSFREGIGAEIVSGKATLHTLEQYALQNKPIRNESGRQERIKLVLNEVIFSV